MKKSQSILFAVVIAAITAFGAPPAMAGGPVPKVTVNSPENNSFHTVPPALSFTSTGTQLTKVCSLEGPGIYEWQEDCSTGYKPLAALPDGAYSYAVSVSNDDGGDGASRNFTIDATAPYLNMTSGPTEGSYNSASTAGFRAAYSDANLASVSCRLDAQTPVACGAGGEVLHQFDGLSEGSHKVSITVTDKAANSSYVERNFVIDRTAPYAAIELVGGGITTRDNTPAFLLGASDDGGQFTKRCRIKDQTQWTECAAGSWLPADPIADGALRAELEVRDRAGNTVYAGVDIELDATLPVVAVSGPLGDRTINRRPALTFSTEDAHETTSKCAFDPAGWDELAACSPETGQLPAADLALGQHQFWVASSDSFGNVASTIYNFEVIAEDTGNPGGGGGGGAGGGGDLPGGDGGAGDTPKLTLTTKSTKVRRGKFTLTITTATSNLASCTAASLTIKPKLRKAKTLNLSAKSRLKGGVCVTTTKVKLAAKFKRKWASIAAVNGGAKATATIKL